MTKLPTTPDERKAVPLARGFFDFFPLAIAAVAKASAMGQGQHSLGADGMSWDRGASGDHADALLRHLMERGTVDTDGVHHATKVAWRAMAMLQVELEIAAAPIERVVFETPPELVDTQWGRDHARRRAYDPGSSQF